MACYPVSDQYTVPHGRCLPDLNDPNVDPNDDAYSDAIVFIPFTEANRLVMQCGTVQYCYNLFSLMVHFLNQMRAGGWPADYNQSQITAETFAFIQKRCTDVMVEDEDMAEAELKRINDNYDINWFDVAIQQGKSALEFPDDKRVFKGYFLYPNHALEIFEEQKNTTRIDLQAAGLEGQELQDQLAAINRMRLPRGIDFGDVYFNTPAFFMDPYGYCDVWHYFLEKNDIPILHYIQHPMVAAVEFISHLIPNENTGHMSLSVTSDITNIDWPQETQNILRFLFNKFPFLQINKLVLINCADLVRHQFSYTQFAHFMNVVNYVNAPHTAQHSIIAELRNLPLSSANAIINQLRNVGYLRIFYPIGAAGAPAAAAGALAAPVYTTNRSVEFHQLNIAYENANARSIYEIYQLLRFWTNVRVDNLLIELPGGIPGNPDGSRGDSIVLQMIDRMTHVLLVSELYLKTTLQLRDVEDMITYNYFGHLPVLHFGIAPAAVTSMANYLETFERNLNFQREVIIQLMSLDEFVAAPLQDLQNVMADLQRLQPRSTYQLIVPEQTV